MYQCLCLGFGRHTLWYTVIVMGVTTFCHYWKKTPIYYCYLQPRISRNQFCQTYLFIYCPQMSWRPTFRGSKFRNVYGKVANREHCFDGIPITKNVHDNHFCAVNSKFVAVVTESAGGGSFIVIPVSQVGGTAQSSSFYSAVHFTVWGGLWMF